LAVHRTSYACAAGLTCANLIGFIETYPPNQEIIMLLPRALRFDDPALTTPLGIKPIRYGYTSAKAVKVIPQHIVSFNEYNFSLPDGTKQKFIDGRHVALPERKTAAPAKLPTKRSQFAEAITRSVMKQSKPLVPKYISDEASLFEELKKACYELVALKGGKERLEQILVVRPWKRLVDVPNSHRARLLTVVRHAVLDLKDEADDVDETAF
jgi:hypothetical protein